MKGKNRDQQLIEELIPPEVLQTIEEMKGKRAAFEAWLENGKGIVNAVSLSNWRLGDWLLNGEGLEYTDDDRRRRLPYAEAETLTGISAGALRNIVMVCKAIPPSLRNDKLSFSHHLAVRNLPPDQIKEQLNMAALGNLSVSDFRGTLGANAGPKNVNPTGTRSEEQKQIETNLRTIAEHRGINPGDLKLEIYKDFLKSKKIQEELVEASDLSIKMKEVRAKREEAFIVKSFDDILAPFERGLCNLTASEVAETWKINTGREFTNKVYKSAMKNTLLAVHFSEIPFSEFEQVLVH